MARPSSEFVAREPKALTWREGAHVAAISLVAAVLALAGVAILAAALPREW